MLVTLIVSNLAIIDRVEVDFQEGFNVLTGETGAGKSILIEALNLLMGGRASADLLRSGEEEAFVQGCFELPASFGAVEELDDIAPHDEEIILTRRINRNGRSKCLLNGKAVTLGSLQLLGKRLVTIFGQHEQRILLDTEEHIEILDGYGELKSLRNRVVEAYGDWKRVEKDVLAGENKLLELQEQRLENKSTIEELTKASLVENEEDDLVTERDILRKAVQIREKAFTAYGRLYSKSGSLMEGLADVRKIVDYIASVNPKCKTMKESLEESLYRLEDVVCELRDISENFHADPQRLDVIEERLALIRKLKKKYGLDVPGLLTYLSELNDDEGAAIDAKAVLNNLKLKTREAWEAYLKAAEELSLLRRSTADKLETAMKNELNDLAMPNAKFIVDLKSSLYRPSAYGLDSVEFLLASNAGEEAKPLAKIASGGELSRIMLALKALQIDNNSGETVIFDEVDSGIGGHTAYAVGSRLARVARGSQVLCITHLHQVAALANHHLAVRKKVQKGRTIIEVINMDCDQRIEELIRMLGAAPESKSAREHVLKLMETSQSALEAR